MPTVGARFSPDQVAAYVRARAPSLGIDPAATLGVGEQEGLFSTSPGDGGTSFGPWQLHAGGALPAEVWSQGPAYADAWAWSQEGIDYALYGIWNVSHGMTGASAVASIVTNFERPRADLIPGEISRAIAALGKWSTNVPITNVPGPIVTGPGGIQVPGAPQIPAPPQVPGQPQQPGQGGGTTDTKPPAQVVAQTGIAGALQALVAGAFGGGFKAANLGKPDLSGLILLLAAIFAILIGAILWRGDTVKKYGGDAAIGALAA